MFAVDKSFTSLTARRDQVLVVVHSINAVSVKVPDFPTSPAMGYFVAWDVGQGSAAAAIYLHYAELQKAAVYAYEPRTFALTALMEVTEEATAFLESMGFMVDDAAYGTLRPEEQIALLERLPIFQRDLVHTPAGRPSAPAAGPAAATPTDGAVSSGEPPSERAQAVGRMLMSF